MVTDAPTPTLTKFGKCRSCGSDIGWVRAPQGKWRPVDLEPKPLGDLALLPDGVRAMPLDDPSVPLLIRSDYAGPRYVLHFLTCPARGMRTSDWAVEQFLSGDPGKHDPAKERRRRARLAADRQRD